MAVGLFWEYIDIALCDTAAGGRLRWFLQAGRFVLSDVRVDVWWAVLEAGRSQLAARAKQGVN